MREWLFGAATDLLGMGFPEDSFWVLKHLDELGRGDWAVLWEFGLPGIVGVGRLTGGAFLQSADDGSRHRPTSYRAAVQLAEALGSEAVPGYFVPWRMRRLEVPVPWSSLSSHRTWAERPNTFPNPRPLPAGSVRDLWPHLDVRDRMALGSPPRRS